MKQDWPLVLLLAPLAIFIHNKLLTKSLIWLNKHVKWCPRHNIHRNLLKLALPYSNLFPGWLDLVIYSQTVHPICHQKQAWLKVVGLFPSTSPRRSQGNSPFQTSRLPDCLPNIQHLSSQASYCTALGWPWTDKDIQDMTSRANWAFFFTNLREKMWDWAYTREFLGIITL